MPEIRGSISGRSFCGDIEAVDEDGDWHSRQVEGTFVTALGENSNTVTSLTLTDHISATFSIMTSTVSQL